MIRLTRLNKQPIGVNSDLIKFVENSPDTMITLITGEKILVRESYEEIVKLVVAFRRRVLTGVDLLDPAGPGIAALHAGAPLQPAEGESAASARDSDLQDERSGERD